jgi:FkbM family methyltransferase
MPAPLLSIAIPSYGRPDELEYSLSRFVEQVGGQFEEQVEIIITDDRSTDSTPAVAKRFAEKHPFIQFRSNAENIGLEQNLINCVRPCTGKYLWIFGNDDFLELDDSLERIMSYLEEGNYSFYILNRTRRNTSLTKLLSPNWMEIDSEQEIPFSGLEEFCLEWGLISVIGFITVNIFEREKFAQVDPSPYWGTMYPQLGMMLQVFHDSPCLLVGRPLICHRTATMEEKKAALGDKETEKDFMSSERFRNAKFFSLPFVAMLRELVRLGCLDADTITRIPENTVINGRLVDFLIESTVQADELEVEFPDTSWEQGREFFASLALDRRQRTRINSVFIRRLPRPSPFASSLTFSAVTPSFNQAEFLPDCLASVQEQTLCPIEHLVYDPGSTDGSRRIAEEFEGVTLVAETDEGQSDALNKGFARIRGDIFVWLNSDDYLHDEKVLERVARRFEAADKPDIVYGRGIYVDGEGEYLRDAYVNPDPSTLPWRLQQEAGIMQPAVFLRRKVVEEVGLLALNRHYCMDYEYWVRCLRAGFKFTFVDDNFAVARYHLSNKTYGDRDKSYADVCDMLVEQFGYANHVWLRRYAEYLAEGFDGVLANADNCRVGKPELLEQHYKALLTAYNANHDTLACLQEKRGKKGHGDTLREMERFGIGQLTPCKTIPLDLDYEPGHVAYTVGPRRWAYEATWEKAQIEKTHALFREAIDARTSDTCIVVGNGPSLNKINLDLLEGQDVIISNNAFLSPELLRHSTYYTVVNYLVAEQSAPRINQLEGVAKVLPYWLSYCLNEGQDTYFADAVGHAEFSRDIFKNMSWRHTVTFYNLHLAYGLGYRKVVMIGFDHSYRQESGVKEGEVILSDQSDLNHFNPDYFRGKKWQAADVDMMEAMYKLAKEAYEEDGREIINATVGGALELFPRQSLESVLGIDLLAGPCSREDNAEFAEDRFLGEWLPSHLGRKGLMLDVGAHHGWSLQPFVKADWEVHAFEPDPANRKHLERRFGKSRNVTINTSAVDEKGGRVLPFYTSGESTGISSLNNFRDTHETLGEVPTVSLRDYCRDKGIQRVDFLKIDVEGYDFFALKGFPWESTSPKFIIVEFEDLKTERLGYCWSDVADFLQVKGYTVLVSEWHPILRYGQPHDWRQLQRYPCRLANQDAWGNIIAFKEDLDLNELASRIRSSLTYRVTPPPAKELPLDHDTQAQAPPSEKVRSAVPLVAGSPKGLASIALGLLNPHVQATDGFLFSFDNHAPGKGVVSGWCHHKALAPQEIVSLRLTVGGQSHIAKYANSVRMDLADDLGLFGPLVQSGFQFTGFGMDRLQDRFNLEVRLAGSSYKWTKVCSGRMELVGYGWSLRSDDLLHEPGIVYGDRFRIGLNGLAYQIHQPSRGMSEYCSGRLLFKGWCFSFERVPAVRVRVLLPRRSREGRTMIHRPALSELFGKEEYIRQSGFEIEGLKVGRGVTEFTLQVCLEDRGWVSVCHGCICVSWISNKVRIQIS